MFESAGFSVMGLVLFLVLGLNNVETQMSPEVAVRLEGNLISTYLSASHIFKKAAGDLD